MRESRSGLNIKSKTNNVKIATRKPFSDKNNLLNKLYIEEHDEHNFLPSKIHSNKNYKPSTQGNSKFNSDWEDLHKDIETLSNKVARKMILRKRNHLPTYETSVKSTTSYVDGVYSGNTNKHLAITSPVVNINHLSDKYLKKYLKRCSVKIVKDNLFNGSKIKATNVDVNINNSLGKESISEVTTNNYLRDSHIQYEGHTLRDRKQGLNYAKLQEGSSFGDETILKRSGTKRNLDVYKFVPDSDEENVPFEKEMQLVMSKIENRFKKQQRKKKTANSKRGNPDCKVFQTKPINTNRKIKNKIIPSHTNNVNANLRSKKKYQLLETNIVPKDIRDNSKGQPVDVVSMNNERRPKIDILQNIVLEKSRTTENNVNRHKSLIPKVNNILDENNTVNIVEYSEDMNNIINKLNTRNRTPTQCDDQDALNGAVSDNESLSDLFDFDEVVFSSTLINTDSNRQVSTPWRSNMCSNHNPHFLQYKSTALPSYNQEMVIDSSAIEKMYQECKTPNGSNKSKKQRQTNILSYIDKKSKPDSPDIIESSLFDMHELSPIKKSISKLATSKQKSKSSVDKENMPLRNTPNKGFEKVKRRILREKRDNRISGSDHENITKSSEANRISDSDQENSYFGFQNVSNNDENEDELEKSKKRKRTWLFGKPLRLEDCIKVTKKSKNLMISAGIHEQNKATKEVEIEKEGLVEGELVNKDKFVMSKDTDIPLENQELVVALFQDLQEPNKNVKPKQYVKKTRKRLRKSYVHSEDESEDSYPVKKNKNIRTRKEQEEADKWARAFNKMCEEVDSFPLAFE